MVKDMLEAFLELEKEEHLGYAKNNPEGRGTGNSRNGSTGKPVRTDLARRQSRRHATATAVSSRRSYPSGKPRSGNFSELVVSLYARGMSTREIEEHIPEIYALETVADPLIVCGDGLTDLRQAAESVFPHADVQRCVVHHIRNATKFVS